MMANGESSPTSLEGNEKTMSEERKNQAKPGPQKGFRFVDVRDPNIRRRGRPRQHQAPAENPPTSSLDVVAPRNIMFVDLNDPNSRREARSHAQRETRSHREVTAEAAVESELVPETNLQTIFQNRGMALEEESLDPLSELGHHQAVSNPSLDSLCNLATVLDLSCHELVNHFVALSARWLAQFHAQTFYTPIREGVLSVGVAHQAGVHIILSYAAYCLADYKGETDPEDALHHKAKAFNLINQSLQDPTQRVSDGLLSAVVLAVWLEHQWGTYESLVTHLDGLQRMLQSRGGPQSLRDNRSLDLCVSWHLILTGAIQASRLQQSPDNTLPSQPGTFVWHYLDMLVTLLENLDVWIRLSQDTLPGSANFGQIRHINFRREAAFGRNAPLHATLSASPMSVDASHPQAAALQSCRIFCLVYLNMVLWECRHSPESYTQFLTELNFTLHHTDPDRDRGIEALTWVLIGDIDKPAHRWDAHKLMVVMEVLCEESKTEVQDFLLKTLSASLNETLMPLSAEFIGTIRTEIRQRVPGEFP